MTKQPGDLLHGKDPDRVMAVDEFGVYSWSPGKPGESVPCTQVHVVMEGDRSLHVIRLKSREIENGHSDPSLATLQSIAKAFGVGAGDLLVQAGYTVNPKSLHLAEICVQVTDSYGNQTMHRVPVKENGS